MLAMVFKNMVGSAGWGLGLLFPPIAMCLPPAHLWACGQLGSMGLNEKESPYHTVSFSPWLVLLSSESNCRNPSVLSDLEPQAQMPHGPPPDSVAYGVGLILR